VSGFLRQSSLHEFSRGSTDGTDLTLVSDWAARQTDELLGLGAPAEDGDLVQLASLRLGHPSSEAAEGEKRDAPGVYAERGPSSNPSGPGSDAAILLSALRCILPGGDFARGPVNR